MDGGLNRLSRGRFTNYSTEQGLRSNDVTAILCEDQHVWVGTTDGSLHLVRNDRVLALPTKGGISSGHALQILDDGRGSIWMTGERGITRLERSDLLKVANSNVDAATARVYDFRDGFGRWEFQGVSQSSGVRRADGSLAFPSATGVVIVRSEAFVKSTVAPFVKVLEVLADGRPIPIDDDARAAGRRQAARGALHRDQPGRAEPGAVPLQAGRRRRRLGRRRPAPRRVLLEPERRPLSLPGHRDEQRRRAEPARRDAVVARRAAVLGDVVVLRPRRRRLPVHASSSCPASASAAARPASARCASSSTSAPRSCRRRSPSAAASRRRCARRATSSRIASRSGPPSCAPRWRRRRRTWRSGAGSKSSWRRCRSWRASAASPAASRTTSTTC